MTCESVHACAVCMCHVMPGEPDAESGGARPESAGSTGVGTRGSAEVERRVAMRFRRTSAQRPRRAAAPTDRGRPCVPAPLYFNLYVLY